VIRHSSLANTVLLKLIQGKTIDRANHLGFLRMAIVRATKNVLFDIYRHRASRKRSMGSERAPDYPWLRQFDEENWDLLELNHALEELEQIDLRKASVISMRYFMQMTMQEIADSLGVSKSTVEADWSFSRAWLKKRLE
jgi:RNA polymerase sigma factor (TIGR02999 family)